MQTPESNPCGFCHKDEDGNIVMYYYAHPENPGYGILLSVFDGKFIIKIDDLTKDSQESVSCEINYCPFCGRAFRDESTAIQPNPPKKSPLP